MGLVITLEPVDDRPETWKRPLGASISPRGRFRVGWRGGSQLLRSHYDSDDLITSQALIEGGSTSNPALIHSFVYSFVHRAVPRSTHNLVHNLANPTGRQTEAVNERPVDRPEGDPCC